MRQTSSQPQPQSQRGSPRRPRQEAQASLAETAALFLDVVPIFSRCTAVLRCRRTGLLVSLPGIALETDASSK